MPVIQLPIMHLAKAVEWGAEVILSVPCCQHELNLQMKNESAEACTEIRNPKREDGCPSYRWNPGKSAGGRRI